jgi:hypothetical protein
MPQLATGSSLIAALEHTWAAIRQHHPDLPEVVFITGTGLKHAAVSNIDAKWGHFGAQRWVAGHPQATPETDHDATVEIKPDRKPELFVAGECFAEGATHTLLTILHEATHALAHARGVKDTSRQGKYHNRRFLELAGELDLAWPTGAKTHPVRGFSEVQLTDQARTMYAETIGELDAAITLHLETFRRLAGGGQTFTRAKLVCACYPERSIRVSPKQAARGPILCGVCGAEFQAEDDAPQ